MVQKLCYTITRLLNLLLIIQTKPLQMPYQVWMCEQRKVRECGIMGEWSDSDSLPVGWGRHFLFSFGFTEGAAVPLRGEGQTTGWAQDTTGIQQKTREILQKEDTTKKNIPYKQNRYLTKGAKHVEGEEILLMKQRSCLENWDPTKKMSKRGNEKLKNELGITDVLKQDRTN